MGRSLATAQLVMALVAVVVLVAIIPPGHADSGGPDAYGYRWVDSKFPTPGVAYSWIDGVSGGTDLRLGNDTCTLSRIPIGFQFRFYNTLYIELYVCSNGFLAFNTPGSFPWDAGMDDFVAGYGVGLGPANATSGHIFVKADTLSSPRRFIVTWNGVEISGTSNRQTFEIVLIENPSGLDGQILLQYASITSFPPPTQHLVGIDSLGSTSNLYYTKPLENSLAVMFLPPGSAPPGDTLVLRGTNLAPATVEPGRKDVPMLQLNMSTATNSVNLRRVRVDVTGITSRPGDVSSIALWRDTDGNGQFNKTLDTRLVSATPAGSPESASLILPAPVTILAGPGMNFFVAFDIPLTAVPGDWIGAGVLAASYIAVDPPDNVSSVNFPLNSYISGARTQIVEGADTLRVTSWSATNPTNVTQWQNDVPMFSFTMDADKGAVTIRQITVTFLGNRSADVRLVKLSEDTNHNLILDPGTDRVLGKGRFDATGNVSLPTNLQVVAGTPDTLWVSYDIAPNATVLHRVGARISSSAMVAVQGTMDRVDPANFPVQTPSLSTVRAGSPPAIGSRWATTAPNPDGRLLVGEYVLSTQNSRDLSSIGGNTVNSTIIVENNASYLYVAYDAIGDASRGPNDTASMAFRTNRTAFPLAPPDDEFGVGGAMGPFHAVWNGTMGTWRIQDNCNATFDTNHSGLACSIGFGGSPLRGTPHRIYEFRIPLRLLKVPLPFTSGYTLGFAAQSNWSQGVVDRDTGGNSSWPFADPMAPPTWYGIVRLAQSPPPNTPPRLNWTGEPGFTADGVNPDSGTTRTTYEFRINYTDADGNPPAIADPRLHLLFGASEVAGSPFSMVEANPADKNVRDGKVYRISLTFSVCPRTFSYFFSAYDDLGANATPTPTLSGPSVTCPPNPPTLVNGTVAPSQGYANATSFSWSVEYRDIDQHPPARINLTVYKAGSPLFVLPLTLQAWLGPPNNYTTGALFGVSRNLSAPGGDYSFSFFANDSVLDTTTPRVPGPTVVAERADLLLASFSDDAPLVEDQGRRNVKMFTAILQAQTNSITFTGLRIDRAGPSFDSDIAMVRVYHDVNADGTPGPTDVLLGQGTFSAGHVSFSGFAVQLRAGSPAQLIVLVDVAPNAIADDRIGLRVRDATYITVAAPDVVAPFATFQSTNMLVNAPPTALGLTANGFSNNTTGVLHLTNRIPSFAWTFSDPNANNILQAGYNVTAVPLPSGPAVWSTYNQTGSANLVVYGGPALVDGVKYRVNVRLFDGRIWGPPRSLEFRLNTPPPAPILSGPPDNAVNQGPGNVTLRWNAVADAEGDPVSVRWTLATRADFVGAVNGTTPLRATSANVATVGATRYYWRLEAFDQYEWGPVSGARSFVTTATSGRIFGRVVYSGSGLLAIARVFTGTGTLVRETTTSANGSFAFLGVPLALYEVRVTSPGYQPKTIQNVNVSAATPAFDLGDIEMVPTPPAGFDWTGIITYGIVIAAIAAAVAVGIVLGRRRRRETPSSEAAPRTAAAPPAAIGTLQEAPEPQALEFECPECGADVTADATSCPGCGAIFE